MVCCRYESPYRLPSSTCHEKLNFTGDVHDTRPVIVTGLRHLPFTQTGYKRIRYISNTLKYKKIALIVVGNTLFSLARFS